MTSRRMRTSAVIALLLLLPACAATAPIGASPSSGAPTSGASTPSPVATEQAVPVTPLDPCELVGSADRVAVFGSDLGDGSYAENLRGESHQVFTTSGCTWSNGRVILTAELTEPRDFPAAEVVCLAPIETGVAELPGVGDRAWSASTSAGRLVRACTIDGVADVTVAGSADPLVHAAAIARVLLAAVPPTQR